MTLQPVISTSCDIFLPVYIIVYTVKRIEACIRGSINPMLLFIIIVQSATEVNDIILAFFRYRFCLYEGGGCVYVEISYPRGNTQWVMHNYVYSFHYGW